MVLVQPNIQRLKRQCVCSALSVIHRHETGIVLYTTYVVQYYVQWSLDLTYFPSEAKKHKKQAYVFETYAKSMKSDTDIWAY